MSAGGYPAMCVFPMQKAVGVVIIGLYDFVTCYGKGGKSDSQKWITEHGGIMIWNIKPKS
jgi:hypothetical protein